MSRAKRDRQGFFYDTCKTGDEIGGMVIEFVFRYKTLNGVSQVVYTGKYRKGMENYDKSKRLVLKHYNFGNQSFTTSFFQRRDSLRLALLKLLTLYPPKNSNLFYYATSDTR